MKELEPKETILTTEEKAIEKFKEYIKNKIIINKEGGFYYLIAIYKSFGLAGNIDEFIRKEITNKDLFNKELTFVKDIKEARVHKDYITPIMKAKLTNIGNSSKEYYYSSANKNKIYAVPLKHHQDLLEISSIRGCETLKNTESFEFVIDAI